MPHWTWAAQPERAAERGANCCSCAGLIGGSGAAFNFCIPELHSINEATRQEYRSLGKAKKNMQKALAWEEIAEDIHAIQIETSGWVKHHNEWESKLIHGFRYPDAAKLTVMHAVQLYVMQIAMRCKAYIDRPTDGCEPESEEELLFFVRTTASAWSSPMRKWHNCICEWITSRSQNGTMP